MARSRPSAKIVVIGAGMAGLTTAAYLAQAGYPVTIFEQFERIGGVTTTITSDNFRWDIGPLLLQGFAPDERAGRILKDLGIADQVPLQAGDRAYIFPDFDLSKPEAYKSRHWRRERLKRLFPMERESIAHYYWFYNQSMALLSTHIGADRARGLRRWLFELRTSRVRKRLQKERHWSAEKLMEHLFVDPRLKAVFTAALADAVVRPSRFPAIGVPMINAENSFDRRIPRRSLGRGRRPSYHFVLGGCGRLVEAVAQSVRQQGGRIYTNTTVNKILINGDRVTGVRLAGGRVEPADVIVASGGAYEVFFQLVGREYLPLGFAYQIDQLPLMESAFIVQLGVDMDPTPYQPEPLAYYYDTYDIPGIIRRCQEGIFPAGRDRFLVYIPTLHSPELAPSGHHAITIYTIAPNELAKGTWKKRREAFADSLVAQAERFIPRLGAHTKTRVILTPEDFRERTHQIHHAFGGRAPIIGHTGPGHTTPIQGLWFVGAQSKSGGGVENVMIGARDTARAIQKEQNERERR